jgi:hypothetical protein
MSGAPTRRALLGAFAFAALAPALIRNAAAQGGGRLIAPPPEMMTFSRKLRRGLGGGYALNVERQFDVRFERIASGFVIDGEQVAVSVDAPPNLEALARIERERREERLFPLLLDQQGLIRSGPDGGRPSANLEQAIDVALEQLAAGLKSQRELIEAREFILGLQLAAGAIISEVPVDLFVPPQTVQQASRRIDLPDGLSGMLSTQYSGRVSAATGLLEEASRIVVTETGGSRRESVESWSMGPHG